MIDQDEAQKIVEEYLAHRYRGETRPERKMVIHSVSPTEWGWMFIF